MREPAAHGARLGRGMLLLSVIYVVLVGGALSLQWGRTAAERDRTWPSESYDEVYFHLPVIERFARELPTPDLRDYQSATTPGYHLLGAVLHRLGGAGTVRLFYAACALLLPLLVHRALAPRLDAGAAILLAALLCLSSYFVAAATWITTDNLALLFVTLALVSMLAALDREDGRACAEIALAVLAVVAAVLVRQIHLWLCGPLFITALLLLRRDVRCALLGAAGCAAAIAVVGAFVLAWSGLTPPGFATQHAGGWNLAALAYILALFGALSVFFVGFLAPARDDWIVLALGAVVGIVVGVVLATAPDPQAGRWGGVLWALAEQGPIVAGRSVVFVLLCPLGAAAVLLWLKRAWACWGDVLVLALVAFAAAHIANFQVWQRYYEPFLLIVLALLASRSEERRAWALWPVAVLAVGLAAIAALKVYLPLLNS